MTADLEQLLRELDDADELTRADAADQLGAGGHAAAADRLAALLSSDESALVRAAAAESLGDLPTVAATLPALRGALGDADAAVRGYAANALGLHGDAATLALLGEALAVELSPEARAELHGARYRLGSQADLTPLLGLLAGDPMLGINVLNVVGDLLDRRRPPTLDADRATLDEALAQAATIPLLTGQAEKIRARLTRG